MEFFIEGIPIANYFLSCFSVWCISGVWIPCWVGCLLWLLGAIMCIWCAPTGDLSDKLFRFTFIERFVLLQAAVRLLWLFGGDVVVPTLEAACGDSPELSVVGAEGFEDVLCEANSFPPFPLGPTPPPLVPDDPELPVTVFEHLKHFGSHEWRRMNFLYSFLTYIIGKVYFFFTFFAKKKKWKPDLFVIDHRIFCFSSFQYALLHYCERQLSSEHYFIVYILLLFIFSYLFVLNAVEYEDEKTLKAVEYSKDVCHYHWFLIQVEESKSPG